MVKNLVRWCQIFEVLQLQPQKNVQSDHIYVSMGIIGLSHVRARQCTKTPSLQDG